MGGGVAGDGAEADEAEPLAGDLAADQLRLGELARHHRGIGEIGAAQQHHGAADDVFDDGEAVGPRRREDLDAARVAGFHVDVVETDAEPADDLQLLCRRQDIAPHLRLVADDQGGDIADELRQFVGLAEEIGVVMDAVAGAEHGDRRLVHEFRDDDVGHGRRLCSYDGQPSASRLPVTMTRMTRLVPVTRARWRQPSRAMAPSEVPKPSAAMAMSRPQVEMESSMVRIG